MLIQPKSVHLYPTTTKPRKSLQMTTIINKKRVKPGKQQSQKMQLSSNQLGEKGGKLTAMKAPNFARTSRTQEKKSRSIAKLRALGEERERLGMIRRRK